MTNTAEDQSFNLEIDNLKSNLISTIKHIETVLNIKLDFTVDINGNTIIIKGVDDFSFTVYKWFKTNPPDKPFLFNCTPFRLSPLNTQKSTFSIFFDAALNLISSKFYCMSRDVIKGDLLSIFVEFHHNLELKSIKISNINLITNKKFIIKKNENQLCPLNDEILLFKLGQNKDVDLIELLPECYIPAAYNFNSEDFLARLEVFSMFQV